MDGSILLDPNTLSSLGAAAVLLWKLLEHEKRLTQIEQKINMLIDMIKNGK